MLPLQHSFSVQGTAFGEIKTISTKTLNAKHRTLNGNKGAILLATLVLLLTINMIGATLTSLFTSVTTIAGVEHARAQALYLAEAGLTQAIHQLRLAGLTGGHAELKLPRTRLGGGEYYVDHDIALGVITSTGDYHGIKRTIQLRYQVF